MTAATLKKVVETNLPKIRERVHDSLRRAGRQGEEVTIVAISKGMPFEAILAVVDAGIHDVGENRVQEASDKIPEAAHCLGSGPWDGPRELVPPGGSPDLTGSSPARFLPRWHMVGHLQSRKAKAAAGLFDIVQSVDSLKIAQELSKRAGDIGKKIDILVEVNTSGEQTKYGAAPGDAVQLVSGISALDSVSIKGLMTIGPLGRNKEFTRESFRLLRSLRDEIDRSGFPGVEMKYLSMGMSDDFELAIEEGSNMVRIGTAIFKGSGLHSSRKSKSEGLR